MNIGEYINGKAQQPLTPILKSHEVEIGDFSKLCSNLCMKLLRLLAVGLQVSRSLFTILVGGIDNVERLLD